MAHACGNSRVNVNRPQYGSNVIPPRASVIDRTTIFGFTSVQLYRRYCCSYFYYSAFRFSTSFFSFLSLAYLSYRHLILHAWPCGAFRFIASSLLLFRFFRWRWRHFFFLYMCDAIRRIIETFKEDGREYYLFYGRRRCFNAITRHDTTRCK